MSTSNNDNLGPCAFTDGGCIGNPGPGGWGFVLLTENGEVLEQGGSEAQSTNNRMELTAVIAALDEFLIRRNQARTFTVLSDSQYVINGATKWLQGWKRKDWKSLNGNGDIANKDLWQRLDDVMARAAIVAKISFKYVAGHSGVPANERVDEIANSFAEGKSVSLFNGDKSKYNIDLSVTESAFIPTKKKRGGYYLSYVDGIIYRDKTWPECEARVKGRSGVKFKKCGSAEEEIQILDQWKVPQDAR